MITLDAATSYADPTDPGEGGDYESGGSTDKLRIRRREFEDFATVKARDLVKIVVD